MAMNSYLLKFTLIVAALILSACAGTRLPDTTSSSKAQMSSSDAARYHHALTQLAQNKPEQASRTLYPLSEKYPTDPGLWLNLATAHYQNNAPAQAEEALTQVEKLNQTLPQVHNLRGLMATERGEYQAAEQHYQAAIEMDPQHPQSQYNLALLYDIFYQDVGAALPYYQHYLALINGEDEETANWVRQIELSLGGAR